jgi:hypothetical protein
MVSPRSRIAALLLLPMPLVRAQQPPPAGVRDKLRIHTSRAFGPLSLAGSAAYAGLLHELDAPREWGQGAAGYGRRLASNVGFTAIRNAFAFTLDATLHDDPRYIRVGRGRFWPRVKYAVRETILTRTDSRGHTFAVWRFGSAYGAAFLSNTWYPDRLNTVGLGFAQGSATISTDVLTNLAYEFWPDVRKKILRR